MIDRLGDSKTVVRIEPSEPISKIFNGNGSKVHKAWYQYLCRWKNLLQCKKSFHYNDIIKTRPNYDCKWAAIIDNPWLPIPACFTGIVMEDDYKYSQSILVVVVTEGKKTSLCIRSIIGWSFMFHTITSCAFQTVWNGAQKIACKI